MTESQNLGLTFLPPPKGSPACLSHRQIVRIAAGAESKDMFMEHLQNCNTCAVRLDVETQAFTADARQALPPQLARALRDAHDRQTQRRWRAPTLLVSSMAAMALAAVLVLRISPLEQTTLKGSTAILASVQRNGVFIAQDRDAQTIKQLQPGDHLSIHVVGAKAHQKAYVQVAEEGGWRDYYRGEVPSDGWLPLGLEVTAGEPTHVRIAVCDSMQSDGAVVDAMSPTACTLVALEL